MSDIKDRQRKILEGRLETLWQDYEAAINQIDTERGAVEKNKLQRQADEIFKSIEELDAQLESLELAPSVAVSSNSEPDAAPVRSIESELHKIDFDFLEEAIRKILREYRQDGCAALLLFQESERMGGEWCAARVRELLRRETDDGLFREYPIGFRSYEQANGMALLRGLGQYLSLEFTDQSPLSFSEQIIQKLCGSLQSGSIVMIECRGCDDLFHKPTEFHWVLKDFWRRMVHELSALSQELYEVKIILLFFLDQDLPVGSLAAEHRCTPEQLDKNRILDIPLTPWTREDIGKWIARYSGLSLSRRQIDRMAKKIHGATGGDPTLVAHKLLKECCPASAGSIE